MICCRTFGLTFYAIFVFFSTEDGVIAFLEFSLLFTQFFQFVINAVNLNLIFF